MNWDENLKSMKICHILLAFLAGLQLMTDNTVEQAIEIIRRRLDPDGTKSQLSNDRAGTGF